MAKKKTKANVVDRTKNNKELEQYKQALKKATTYRERLDKIESTKGKFSEKVYKKVHGEYVEQLADAERILEPFRENFSTELHEFHTLLKELSIVKDSRSEEWEELNLRCIAGEFSEEELQSRQAEIEPELKELGQKIEILNHNIEIYSQLVKGVEPDSDSELVYEEHEEEASEEGEGAADFSEDEEQVEEAAVEAEEREEEKIDEEEEVVEGANEELDSWHELPDEEDSEETPFQEEESIPQEDDEDSYEEPAADGLDQTLEEDYDLDLPEDLRRDLEEPEETTPAEVAPDVETQPCLVIVEGDSEESEILIDQEVLTIGRGPDNDLQLANDTSVSRHHSRITYENGEFVITDLDSSNGTYVNGERVSQIALSPEDEISIGQTLLVLKFKPRF